MPEYGRNGTILNLSAIQLKCKNASAWTESEVLLAGEVGVELDTHKAKIGDGTTAWSALPYSSDPTIQTLVDGLTTRVTEAEGSLTSLAGRMDTAEGNITSQGTRLTTAEGDITTAKADIDAAESRLDTAESDIDALEAKDTTHESRMTTIEAKDTEQDGRLSALEGITVISGNPFRE